MNVFDFSATALDGSEVALSQWRGKVLLVVNTASECGFTPQYAGLEELYRKYKDRGLVVLGFPCNQFGKQEPGTAADIQSFCKQNYDVDFPMFAKVDVNGEHAHPLYKFLKSAAPGVLGTEAIKWNFTKFLVNGDGNVIKRYAPQTRPEELEQDIQRALGG